MFNNISKAVDIKYNEVNKYLIYLLITTIFLFSAGAVIAGPEEAEKFGAPTWKPLKTSVFSQLLNIDSGTLIAKIPEKAAKSVKIDDDTSGTDNRIVKFYGNHSQDIFKLALELKDYELPIQIKVFNILGNEVLDAYNGTPLSGGSEYIIETHTLPNGIYICKVIGKNFHLNRKFIISR